MDTYREYQYLNELWARRGALEGLGMTSGFWQDRPVLVTGATGLVGGWLTRRLVEAGADVVCLVRDWVPQSELVRSRTDRTREGGARRRARPRSARARPRRVRDRHRLSPGRPDHRGHRQPQPGVHVRNATSRAPGTCWKPAAARPARPADRGGVLRQGLRRPGDSCPTPRTTPLQGRHPYDVSKSCADLIAQAYAADLRPAGGDHPLRQFLRRRRPELEPHRARHDPLGAARRSGR